MATAILKPTLAHPGASRSKEPQALREMAGTDLTVEGNVQCPQQGSDARAAVVPLLFRFAIALLKQIQKVIVGHRS